MINNKLELLNGYLGGLNLNPIPLEIGQSLSTTKELALMLHKIDEVIQFTNDWYNTILSDIVGGGILYQKLSEEFTTTFGGEISAIQTSIINTNNTITNLNTLITALQYTKPSVTITSAPSILNYAVGDTINSVMINYNIVKGTNNLVKAEIYKNGSLLTTINNPTNGSNSYVDGSPTTSDTTYYVKVFDDVTNIHSDIIEFKFNYNVYYGKIVDGVSVNEALVQSLNKSIFNSNINYSLSLNDEKIIIVSHDTLKNVFDDNNYDILDSFTLSTINVTINNQPIQFNVYVSTNTILDNNVNIIIEK